jgi:hypothetical protein
VIRRLAAVAALAALGCGSHPAKQPASPLARGLEAALAAADRARVPWRCAAADLPEAPAGELATGARRWRLDGHALRRVDDRRVDDRRVDDRRVDDRRVDDRRVDDDDAIVIGVVADAGGAAPATLAALGRLRARLAAENPDLVLALGGMGPTAAELEATLGALADHATWPVVALPGDLEPMPALEAAVAALRARGDAVLDGRLVRWVVLPGATIGLVPGAAGVDRLVAGADGCAWRADDVAAEYAELGGRDGVRVAATAAPAREVFAGDATGELALVPAAPVDVVLHGPARGAPSPAHDGGRDGGRALLSPGTADATPRLPAIGAPSIGVLVIRRGAWSWRPLVDSR